MASRGNSRSLGNGQSALARLALLAGTTLCAAMTLSPALAQPSVGGLGSSVTVPEGTQLFLEADTVTYDSESQVVTASGGVQIDYGDYQLVARNVVYNQQTQRLLASGDVELIEPSGNRIYADAVDITEDFADGFIAALRIETPDNTRFAAAEAVRRDGDVTTFERGVYTACEACRENPKRPPLWQVKARRIVWDQNDEVVRYYGARFELFGLPLAYLPYFATPDSQQQRASGFLMPQFRSSDETGFGVRVPYFWAIADDKDATVAATYYARQGFLLDAEYRQAFESGFITLKTAGISQNEPDAFDYRFANGVEQINEVVPEDRGMVGTTGRFAINQRWTFGWDLLAQTDTNFSNTYEIDGFQDTYRASEVYLTGLGDQSFFDLRGQRFEAQTINIFDDDVQPTVLPSLDYGTIAEETVLGGQVGLDVNVTSLSRDGSDPATQLICNTGFVINGVCRGGNNDSRFRRDAFRFRAMEGEYTRATAQGSWRASHITEQGLILEPSVLLRGDLYTADMETEPFIRNNVALGGVDVDETGGRGMATAAIEARYPYLVETANTSHVFEPIGQLIVRPDEMKAGLLPNEDAQSLVFNTTNLFALDKFSGYDRIEGGVRANLGLQYSGMLGAGYVIDAVAGQSFHLAGENPFAQTDLALVGADSGLETDRSDYVASLALTTPVGLTFAAQGRLDKDDAALERADLSASFARGRLASSLTYSQIGDQPLYGFAEDREQVSGQASFQLTEELTTFGAVSYDLENASLISRSFGVGYADECFTLLAEYRQTSNRYQLEPAESSVFVRFSLRTLVEAEYSYGLGQDERF